MPRFSSSLISPASLYLFGGSVCFSSLVRLNRDNGSLALTFGSKTSSPLAAGSAKSQPLFITREPLAKKSGMDFLAPTGASEPETSATILVRIISASFIWLATALCQIKPYNFFWSSFAPTLSLLK